MNLKSITGFVGNLWYTYHQSGHLWRDKLLIDEYLRKNLYENPKYIDSERLNKYEYQVFSQNGEDGIIAEIFNRVGTTNKIFVEIGTGEGYENNTVFLLVKDWRGCWIEANKRKVKDMRRFFKEDIRENHLKVMCVLVNAENVENLLTKNKIPKEFDLLSIDIDGNDYWVWRAIKTYSPRVVVIEYNAVFPPTIEWTTRYNQDYFCGVDTQNFGVSLKLLETLGTEKGYKLVGCNFTGINAFFVRDDLVGDKFFEPFTANNHYEPIRYFLARKVGKRRVFRGYVK